MQIHRFYLLCAIALACAPGIAAGQSANTQQPLPDWRADFSEEGLCRNGNTLRNYLTLMAAAEVIEVVFKGQPPSATTRSILGANPPRPENLPAVSTTAESASIGTPR